MGLEVQENNIKSNIKLHILLIKGMRNNLPYQCKILMEWGDLTVYFGDTEEYYEGLHCIIEGNGLIIKNWLKKFDYFILGNGNPIMETFSKYTPSELL